MFTDPCLERHFTGHSAPITQVRFNPSGTQVATCSFDASVILWDLKQAARCIRFGAHSDAVYGVAWSPKSNLVASASKDRSVKIWEPRIRGVSGEFLAHGKPVRSVDFDPSGTMVITASEDKSLKLWKVAQRKFLTSFVGHTNWVRSAKFSPNGQLVASCGDDNTVRIFDVCSGQCVRIFTEERGGRGQQLSWHPNSRILAVGLSCCRIKIFDIGQSELIQLYHVNSAIVNDVAFHPSGNFLLAGSDDGTMKILDLLEGRPIYTLTGHTSRVCAVAFSEDGTRFATGGADRQLLIWKSNLHTYDACAFQNKQSNEPLGESGVCPQNSTVTSADESILIDPRQTDAYKSQDENFKVNDADMCWQPTQATLEASLDCNEQDLLNDAEVGMEDKSQDSDQEPEEDQASDEDMEQQKHDSGTDLCSNATYLLESSTDKTRLCREFHEVRLELLKITKMLHKLNRRVEIMSILLLK